MPEFVTIVAIIALALVAILVPWVVQSTKIHIVNRNELRSKNGNVNRDSIVHNGDSDVILPIRRDAENGKKSG